MAKRGAKKARAVNAKSINNKKDPIFDFVLGIIFFFILEAVFMLGGLLIEKYILNIAATGIPSLLGLVVWVCLSLFYKDKKELFLGGIAISVVVPIILILVTITSFVEFSKIIYYSIILIILLEIFSALFLIKKR